MSTDIDPLRRDIRLLHALLEQAAKRYDSTQALNDMRFKRLVRTCEALEEDNSLLRLEIDMLQMEVAELRSRITPARVYEHPLDAARYAAQTNVTGQLLGGAGTALGGTLGLFGGKK